MELSNWEINKLGHFFDLKQGNHLPLNELIKNGYPVFGANGQIGYYSKYMYKEPVVLITCRGATCGSINLTKPKSWVTGNAIALIPRTSMNIKFVYFHLNSLRFSDVISGSAQPQIIVSNLQKKKFRMPTLSLQDKIAPILQKTESAIEKRKQANQLTDEFLKSAFIEMFGDPLKNNKKFVLNRIKKILEKPLSPGIAGRPVTEKKGLLVIRPYNITSDGNLIYENRKYIAIPKAVERSYALHYDDVVFNNTNSPPLVGKTAVFRSNLKCVYSNHLTRVRLNRNICLPDYFTLTIVLFWRYKFFETRCSQWVNQAAFNCEQLGNLEIPIPPLTLQQKFADLVQKVEKLKQKQKESEKELNNLFNSLMQKAFKGKL